MLNIEAASYYVPTTYIDLNQASELYGLPRNELKVFTRLYGLEKIPYASNIALKELLFNALDKLFKENDINVDDIKFLIYAHTSKVVMSFSDSVIQSIKKRYLLTNAISFGVTINNCASTISAIEMAESLIKDMPLNSKVLIVVGELTFTSVQKIIPKISILGDASSALLVSNVKKQHQLLAVGTIVEGASADGVWMTPEQNQQYERDYAPTFSRAIHRAVAKVGLALSEIKLILPHNVNLPAWSKLAKQLNFPIEKVYLDNVKRYSHCFGSDSIINFVDVLKDNKLQIGDYYMMATVGLGSFYSAAVFQY
jgi:3-oxoacyl-[acyl-carrier-protein] synthase-3